MADSEQYCFPLPSRCPRGHHAALEASLDKCTAWFGPEVSLMADHSLFMDEWDKFSLSVSLTTMTLRGKETPDPLYKPPYKQHNGISWFSHLAWPSLPYFAGPKLPLWEGPKYFVWECAFYSISKCKFNTTQQIEQLLYAGFGEI